jgi:hypothetical protein
MQLPPKHVSPIHVNCPTGWSRCPRRAAAQGPTQVRSFRDYATRSIWCSCGRTMPRRGCARVPSRWAWHFANHKLDQHHRTIAPSHHRTIAPSHHRTIAPSHHRTIAPSHHRTIAPSHDPRRPSYYPLPFGLSTTFWATDYFLGYRLRAPMYCKNGHSVCTRSRFVMRQKVDEGHKMRSFSVVVPAGCALVAAEHT